jgi:hypothetical protein
MDHPVSLNDTESHAGYVPLLHLRHNQRIETLEVLRRKGWSTGCLCERYLCCQKETEQAQHEQRATPFETMFHPIFLSSFLSKALSQSTARIPA